MASNWHDRSLLGQRYVFFSSLFTEASDDLKRLGANAASHFSHTLNTAASKVKTAEKESEQNFESLMQKYIQFLYNTANHMRANEIAYLANHQKAIKKYRDSIKKENPQDPRLENINVLLNIVNQCVRDPSKIDYPQLISALTLLRNDCADYKKNLQEIYNQLKNREKQNDYDLDKKITLEITETDKRTGEKIIKTVERTLKEHMLESGYDNYKKAFALRGFQPLNNTLTQIQADKINKIIDMILKSGSFISTFQKNADAIFKGKKDLSKLLKNIIVNEVNKQYESSSHMIFSDLQNKIQDKNFILISDLIPDTSAVWTKKNLKQSFEEVALTQTQRIAAYVRGALDDEERKALEKKYGKYLSEKMQLLLKNKGILSSHQMGELTKALKRAFEKSMEEQYKQEWDALKNKLKNDTMNQKNQIIMDFLTNILMVKDKKLIIPKNIINKNLHVTIDHYDIAELDADIANTITQKIADTFHTTVQGKSKTKKNDLVFSVSFSKPNYRVLSINEAVDSYVMTLKKFMDEFMDTYHKNSSSSIKTSKTGTNIVMAEKIYKDGMKKLGQRYQEIRKMIEEQGEDTTAFDTYIQETFFGGISVKEYRFYHDKIGFKGGSLGGDYNAIEGINTVFEMMQAGGLAPADKDLIIEAVLNAGKTTVLTSTNPDIIENIKQYLIGGAVLAMFDEGFTNTDKMLDYITEQFGSNNTPKTMQLYQFETLYLPASYLLMNIYENLAELRNMITQEVRMTFKQNNTIEFSNFVEREDVQEHLSTAAERWTDISKVAQSSTSMHVLLLAGLLDLFEHLPLLVQKKQ